MLEIFACYVGCECRLVDGKSMPTTAFDVILRHVSFTEHVQVRGNGVPPREQRHRGLLWTSPRRRGPHEGTRSICQQWHISVSNRSNSHVGWNRYQLRNRMALCKALERLFRHGGGFSNGENIIGLENRVPVLVIFRPTYVAETSVELSNIRLNYIVALWYLVWLPLPVYERLGSWIWPSSYLSAAALQAHTVPLFLEGPTRRMKVLKTKEEKKALYEQVGWCVAVFVVGCPCWVSPWVTGFEFGGGRTTGGTGGRSNEWHSRQASRVRNKASEGSEEQASSACTTLKPCTKPPSVLHPLLNGKGSEFLHSTRRVLHNQGQSLSRILRYQRRLLFDWTCTRFTAARYTMTSSRCTRSARASRGSPKSSAECWPSLPVGSRTNLSGCTWWIYAQPVCCFVDWSGNVDAVLMLRVSWPQRELHKRDA